MNSHADLTAEAQRLFAGSTTVRESDFDTYEGFKKTLFALAAEDPDDKPQRLKNLYLVGSRGTCVWDPPYNAWAVRLVEEDLPGIEAKMREKGLL